MRLWIEHVFIFIVENATVIAIKDGGKMDLWGELNRRFTVPYSKLRHHDATFFAHSVLAVIVDQHRVYHAARDPDRSSAASV